MCGCLAHVHCGQAVSVAASPSSSRDAGACWCATSSASGQPRQFLFSSVSLGRVGRRCALQRRPPRVDHFVVVVRVVARAAPRTRCTGPGSRPGTPAGTAARAPPRPAARARGRAGRPRARAPRPRRRRLPLVVVRRSRRRRTAPGSRHVDRRGRPRPGTARTRRSAAPRTEPVTSTPSMTDSSRRSSSTGGPSGTRDHVDAEVCRRRSTVKRSRRMRPRAAAELAWCRARAALAGRGGSWLQLHCAVAESVSAHVT